MKCNFFKVIVLCGIVHNALISSPIPHLMKNREALSALRMASQAKNRSINNPHKRRIAAEAAVLSVAASSAAAPLFAAGICVGGACFAASKFYELYYGKTFVSAATQAAIKKALFYDEANALKALELVKESKISFEAAYSKVLQLNQRALAIAEQTHESVEVVYKRLEYLEASPEVKYRLDQEALKEQALKNEIARELKNNFAGFQASTQSRHITSAAQSHTESASIARSAAEFNQLATAISSPTQPLHTGHTIPVPKSDQGCTLLPPPQAETSIGCGSTTTVVPETPSGFQISEQPNSTIVCELPAEVQERPLILENSLLKELLEGENEAIKKILKDTIPGRETTGNTAQKIRVGGTYEEALKDFEKIGLSGVKDIPKGKMGYLPDGKAVNVRSWSTANEKPTLEIYNPITKKSVKIRYGD